MGRRQAALTVLAVGIALWAWSQSAGASLAQATTTTSSTTSTSSTSTSTTTSSTSTTSTSSTSTTTTSAPATSTTTTAQPLPTTTTAAAPSTTAAPECDPNYPDLCIPPYPGIDNIDCDSPEVGGRGGFPVLGPDPYGLDGPPGPASNGTPGIGCESNGSAVAGVSTARQTGSPNTLALTGAGTGGLVLLAAALLLAGRRTRRLAGDREFAAKQAALRAAPSFEDRRRAFNQRHHW